MQDLLQWMTIIFFKEYIKLGSLEQKIKNHLFSHSAWYIFFVILFIKEKHEKS